MFITRVNEENDFQYCLHDSYREAYLALRHKGPMIA
jgi:hypothetical protein